MKSIVLNKLKTVSWLLLLLLTFDIISSPHVVQAFLPINSHHHHHHHQRHHTKDTSKDVIILTKHNILSAKTPSTLSLSSQIVNIPNGGVGNIKTTTRRPSIKLLRISSTITATFLTWFIQKQKYTNVLSSSIVTLLLSYILFDNSSNNNLSQSIFCGSFAGMASMTIIPTWQSIVLLGVFTSMFYEIIIEKKQMFIGVGGRLGFTAFLASLLVALLQSTPTGITSLTLLSKKIGTIFGSIYNGSNNIILSMILWHTIGSIVTIILRENNPTTQDPVRASAVVGLVGSLLLQDKTAALALYGGSFVGMSAPGRLMHGMIPPRSTEQPVSFVSRLISFGIAGALGGLIHGLSIELGWFNGGWGGKAGLCAFLGCLCFRLVRLLLNKLMKPLIAT